MKKMNLFSSILNFIASIVFLAAGVINSSKPLPEGAPYYACFLFKYGYFIAATFTIIAAIGFAWTYFKQKSTKKKLTDTDKE